MLSIAWIIGIGIALVIAGALCGARRLLALPTGMIAGAAAAPTLGPMLGRELAWLIQYDAWIADLVCWAAVYLVTVWLVSGTIMRIFADRTDARRGLRWHRSGAIAGGIVGGLLAWSALGNLPELVLERLPEPSGNSTAATLLRRPLEIMRACRTLSSLTLTEAQELACRPEVTAVFDDESLERLLSTPGMLRMFSRASTGDWRALGALASDETVKAAMREPKFVRRLQAVDLLTLADELERRREQGDAQLGANPVVVRLPAFVNKREFRARLEQELSLDAPASADPVGSSAWSLPAGDRKLEPREYWRGVGEALSWCDRTSPAAALAPKLFAPWLRDEPAEGKDDAPTKE